MNDVVKERLRSVRDGLLALSLVNLCFIRSRSGLFYNEQFDYHKDLLVNRQVLLALALDLILLGLVGWRLIRWVRRKDSRTLYRAACVVVCGLLAVPIDFLRTYFFHIPGQVAVVALIKNPFFVASGLIALFAIWRWPRRAAHILAVVPMIFVPGVFLTFGKIGYHLLKSRPEPPPQLPAMFHTPEPSVEPRVVWIIFDELDERMAFSSRPKDCPLPEFDRLSAESLHATNAFPPGKFTDISLPSLTTGHYVIKSTPASRDEMNITYAGASVPVGWSTQPTIFSSAHELGFNTALVGWYHPYSRLFPAYLNFCAWTPYAPFQMVRDNTVLRCMVNHIYSMAPIIQQRRLAIDFYKKSLADSRKVVKDGRYGLVFLHLMGPHYPGIYDVTRGRFTLRSFSRIGGYFQNLQLTDKTMGILRRDMEQAGQWDRTWLIVSSDHWWRDALGYDGNLDYRIPFILKAPGMNQPITYGSPMNTIITHDLVLAILRKEVSTIPETITWLDTHKSPPAPSYAIMQAN